ncbi:MAG: rRNA maturation RNase YbeY [Deltaproteobacteria bacterium]|nr:rRNA maturation RNase YbeY [Deltaproteobacteria bacterium]
MAVLIKNRQNLYKIPQQETAQKAQAILNALDCPDGELSLLILDNLQITELNQKYLNREGPANVIAFPMRGGDYSEIAPQLLGDVVISAEKAADEGSIFNISMEERFMQLIVHGILHLFGYDHEKSDKEALIMEQKSEELLKILREFPHGKRRK